MQPNIFSVRKQPLAVDVVLLLARLIIGYTFLVVGWGKIQHPTNWMQGYSFSPFWQVLAAVAEFGGGIALVLGLVTRLGAFGISCVMVVAIGVMHFVYGLPYLNMKGGMTYQVPVAYLLITLTLLAMGPGRFSLDRLIFGVRDHRPERTNHHRSERTEAEIA